MTPGKLFFTGIVAWCFVGFSTVAQPAPPQALNRLKSDLHLTQEQEASWTTFTQAYVVDPQVMKRQQDAFSSMPTLTGPQRVDLQINFARENLDSLQRRGDALKSFYEALSPEQKQTFDRDTLQPSPD